jgi:phosphopantetheine adenylyltransferase
MEFHSKDIQILRQSQSKLVLDYLTQQNVSVTVEELQRVTDIFVECCLRPMDNDLKDRVRKLDKWILDKKIKTNAEG